MNEHWWMSPQRVIQPILTADEGNIDAEKMVDELHSFGCNTILHNVGGMFAWYPTKIPFHRTPPAMKDDVLGTVCRTAKKYGIHVLGRFDFSGLLEEAFQAHPEWFFIGADHKPMIDKGYYATCMSGSYIEDFVLPIIKEVTSNYHLDGAFFNMFGYRTVDRRGVFHGPCHCDACRKRYQEQMNRPLPAELPQGSPDAIQYQNFAKTNFLDTLKFLNERFKKVNPEFAMLVGNGARSPFIILQGGGESTEVELHWVPVNIKKMSPVPILPWRHMFGDTCRQTRTIPGISSMINQYTCGGGRLTPHSGHTVALGLAQTLANNGWPFIAFTGKPWRWSHAHEAAIKSFYSFMKDNDDCFTKNTSAARIALINSQKDIDLPDGQENFLMEFRGFYSTLVKQHEEFDVLDVLQLSSGSADKLLEKYRLVIVPNVKYLSPAAAALERFVSGGGKILVSGESGIYGENGETAWLLKKIMGIDRVRTVRPWVENAFFRDAGKLLPNTEIVSVNGRVVYAEYSGSTEKLLPLTGEIEYASPELELLYPATDQYGMVVNSFGKGKSVFIPWEIGKLSHIYAQEDHLALIKTAVNLLMEDDRPFITDAPSQVEITLHRQENGRLVLQLVNETGVNGAEVEPPVTLHNISIGVKAQSGATIETRFGKRTQLSGSMKGNYLYFTLPELNLYELIVIG